MKISDQKNIAINPSFGWNELKFWGLFYSEGVEPDQEKVKALENLQPPKSKKELKSFICMMESNICMMQSKHSFLNSRN